MRIAEVIGKITLSKWHPHLSGASWRIVVGLDQEGIRGNSAGRGEPFVILDERAAREGSLIAVSEGAEAAAPFFPELKPIDAYNTAILDHVEIE